MGKIPREKEEGGIKAQKKKAKAAQTCAHPLSLLAFFETSTYVKKL